MLRHLDISKHDVSLLTTFARTVRGDLPVRAVVVSLQPHNFLKFWPNLASDKSLLSKLWNGTEFRRLLATAPPRPLASPTNVASSPLRDHCLPPPLRFVHLRSLRGQKKHTQAWFASLVPDRHAIVKQVVMSLLQLWCKHEKQAGSDNITFFEWPQCKNMVPGIWGGPRCCHFPNILQGGPMKHQEQFHHHHHLYVDHSGDGTLASPFFKRGPRDVQAYAKLWRHPCLVTGAWERTAA